MTRVKVTITDMDGWVLDIIVVEGTLEATTINDLANKIAAIIEDRCNVIDHD